MLHATFFASFKPLRKQTHPISRPPQKLYQVTAFTAKSEHVAGERILRQRCLYHRRQTMHPTTHVGHSSGQPNPRASGQRYHTRCARQSSTTPSTRASTVPRTRMVAAAKVISMYESEPGAARVALGIGVVTGSNVAEVSLDDASPAVVTLTS